MVELSVEVLEVVEGERRNHLRVTTRVHAICIVREQVLIRRAAVRVIWTGIDALHLIEDNALVDQWIVLVLDLVMPTLLSQDARITQCSRVEHSVQVDVDEVVEVLKVAARHWVAGAVWERHSIQERLQARLQQLHKGLFEWVLAAAAENGVLQHVGDAIRILRRRAEDHAERFVFICRLDHGDQLSTSAIVPEEVSLALELAHVLHPLASPAVQLLSNLVLDGHRSLQDCRGRPGHGTLCCAERRSRSAGGQRL
mmetsp:Transcript_11191/g.25072  ORF Transcript_11191/g.25072 Transcript_11191/m.25072 type:complete len:255 (+) Transcript_11191:2371-3135(+)